MISLQALINELVDSKPELTEKSSVIHGMARIDNNPVHLLGVTESTSFGAEQALLMAEQVITILESKSQAPVLLLVDVAGQKLSMRDEWLGMEQYFGHLLMSLNCLRQQGNRLISLIYNQAIGGGFIAFGLMADAIFALPHAELAVMWLEGIARVTKIDLEKLKALSKTLPVFAPGVENFYKMGGLHEVVSLPLLKQRVLAEMANTDKIDRRAALGYERQGRTLTFSILQQVNNCQ